MDAECDVAEQLRQQEIKCHGKFLSAPEDSNFELDSLLENKRLHDEVESFQKALSEKQVKTVSMIDNDLVQLLRNVEKNQVYIGYPGFGALFLL